LKKTENQEEEIQLLNQQLENQTKEYSTRGCAGLRKATVEVQFGHGTHSEQCPCCEGMMDVITEMQHSHILAESKGGKNTRENLVWLCGMCNNNMKATHMAEYHKKKYPHRHEQFLEKLRSWGKKI